MADPICHATQGGLLMLAPFIHRLRSGIWLWTLALAGGVLGALPDLIATFGKMILHDRGYLYESAHFGPIRDALEYIPMYALHLFVDSYTHGPGHQWKVWHERMWLEVMLWLLNAGVIWWFMRIWKKNLQRTTADNVG